MMTALPDDCFVPGAELLSPGHALALLESKLSPVTRPESVPLHEAAGRILAEDVVAVRDVPPADNAAVDGFAVYFDDLAEGAPTILPVGGRIAAGQTLGRPARRGEAYRIFTGAPMPVDAQGGGPDTVAMQEDCALQDGRVRMPAGIRRGANRRRRGEDILRGATVLARGRRLSAPDIGLCASLGLARVSVYGRLRVAVFSTGDEIREPGAHLPEGCIFDSNRYGLMALLEGLGCRVSDLGILPDSRAAIAAALADAAGAHDLLLTSGGVSTGDEDHVRAAVESLGAIHFWRLAIKPGRPIAFGRVGAPGHGAAFIGLPGNPVAVMVTFLRFARPAILKLAGAAAAAPLTYPVAAGFAYKKKRGRVEWLRARIAAGPDGRPVAQKHPKEGSGILTSMSESDGLIELPEDLGEVKPGDLVTFLPFSEVMA